MSKHTPGPWSGGFECVNDSEGRLLALVQFRGVASSSYRQIPPEEGRANSSLMAAAPSLLNALHECCKVIQSYHQGKEAGQRALHIADAAIAKAEGRDL